MSKRIKFVLTAVILSVGFLALSFVPNEDRYMGIAILSALSVILFFWGLFEGLSRNATLLVLFLPAFFTLGVGLFWFLLPSTFLATFPIIALYGVGSYVLISTLNIFTVSTYKKIALSRAAKGVGFVLSLFTSFLLYDATISLRSGLPVRVLIISVITFPLVLQALWTSELDTKINRELLIYSLVFTVGIAGMSALLFFWPVTVISGSLFLTVAMYVLLGLGQSKLEGRLFRTTTRDYILIGLLVFVFMILSTHWR